MRLVQMIVRKYIPDELYGFVSDGSADLFFHVGSFLPGEKLVSPIVGEDVEVHIDESRENPRVVRVKRLHSPQNIQGKVTRFDHKKGYGFIRDDGGQTYYLHQSEMTQGIPVVGRVVEFFVGMNRKGFLRACYVQNLK